MYQSEQKPTLLKYKNKKTELDGILFDSKAEARRYQELKLLLQGGDIWDLKLQPSYVLIPSFTHHGKRYREMIYIADFEYIENGKLIAEDVKGFSTAAFKLKEKLFRYRYPDIELRIVQ